MSLPFEKRVFNRFGILAVSLFAISTVAMADRILFLDEGRIAEQGTHGELIAKGGLYADLFELQKRTRASDGAVPEDAKTPTE